MICKEAESLSLTAECLSIDYGKTKGLIPKHGKSKDLILSLSQTSALCMPILIVEEGFLPTISTLGYVVGKTGSHYSRNSYHKIKSYVYCYSVEK